jgi:hypothetical protein
MIVKYFSSGVLFMKEKMKAIFLSCAVVVISTALTGCGSESSKKTTPAGTGAVTDNIPSKMAVDIPASLKTSASGSKYLSMEAGTVTRVISGGSSAYSQLKSDIALMTSMQGLAGLYAIVADTIITQNPSLANSGEKSISLTVTKSMADKVATLMGGDSGEFDLSECIGQTFPCKAEYTTTGSGDSKYTMKVTIETTTVTISWNEEKTKVTLVDDEGADGKLTFKYDGSVANSDQMTVIFSQTGFTMSMSLQTQGTGVVLLVGLAMTDSVFSMKGYADDNGGYIESAYSDKLGNQFKEKKSFDKSGNNLPSTDTTYSSAFSSAENSGAVSAGDLAGSNAYVVTTDLAAGDYFAYSDNTLASSSFDYNKSVGVGSVSGGYIAITPSGDKSSLLTTAGSTVYLYPITWSSDGTSYTLGTVSSITVK